MAIRGALCCVGWLAVIPAAIAQQSQADQSQPPPSGQSEKGNVNPELPPVKVITGQEKAKPKPKKGEARVKSQQPARTTNNVPSNSVPGDAVASAQNAALVNQVKTLNAARENILPKTGTNTYEVDRSTIEALPQGDNASLDKILLQTPGVYQDSAASGSLHIRNEHANLQYRINGIQLPDGVAGFNQILETSLIGNMAVVTGALPAQYGLRTAGLVDIQTRSGSPTPSGEIGVYGGSNGTFTTNLQYGGVSGNTEYFFTGRFFESDLGIENPTPSKDAIHDHTQQEKFFGYVSTVLPNNARWTVITGGSVAHYQIPDNPGQQPFTAPNPLPLPFDAQTFDSSKTNEQQLEQNYYGVLAFQQSVGNFDYQVAYFSRYSNVHFSPDFFADLAFNGIATDVSRHSFLNGIQADGAWRMNAAHTLRAGVVVSGEQTYVTNGFTTFLTDANGDPLDPAQLKSAVDRNSKLGWLAGAYVQDEWRLTEKLTLNSGLRFDQMWQYVDANQLSPRISLVYKPLDGTVLHAGYARYFTPPPQAIGAPENFHLFDGTVAAAQVPFGDPVLPERSHYFDAGVTQKLAPGLEVSIDAYYKIARDLLDDGQFGAAYVLTAFNYAKGENEGVELKVKYTKDGLMVYGNLAWARQVATQFVTNQYLQSSDDFNFALTHFIPTDHSQTVTASAGASYLVWEGTKASLDMIYGSGLRNGDHNSTHLPGYTQFNLGLSHEFALSDWNPFTVRFDVVNLFDHVYELRDGSGIGVFAPQFGPRRGFFVGLSQKF